MAEVQKHDERTQGYTAKDDPKWSSMLFRRNVTWTTATDTHEYRQQHNQENYFKNILWEVE